MCTCISSTVRGGKGKKYEKKQNWWNVAMKTNPDIADVLHRNFWRPFPTGIFHRFELLITCEILVKNCLATGPRAALPLFRLVLTIFILSPQLQSLLGEIKLQQITCAEPESAGAVPKYLTGVLSARTQQHSSVALLRHFIFDFLPRTCRI